MKKILIIMIINVLCTMIIGCVETSNNIEENAKVEDKQEQVNVNKTVNMIIEPLAEAIKVVLIDRGIELWPGFNNNGNQILLVSTGNDKAYLINNQNDEVGNKNEIIEYSARSLESTVIDALTASYAMVELNGYETYAFNIDFWADMKTVMEVKEDVLFDEMLSAIVHEAVHLLLQPNQATVEGEIASRGTETVEHTESRYLRNEVYNYLIKACETRDYDENIGKAIYFHNEYLEKTTDENYIAYDYVEGLATYLGIKACVMHQNPNIDSSQLKEKTMSRLVKKQAENKIEGTALIEKSFEPYQIGALAIAVLESIDENIDYNLNNTLSLLENYFSSITTDSNQIIMEKVTYMYNESNKNNQDAVAQFESLANNSDYIGIIIPMVGMNMSVEYIGDFLNYVYNDTHGMVVQVTTEIKYPDGNRIKLKNALSFEYMNPEIIINDNGSMDIAEDVDLETFAFSYHLVYVNKDDVEISNDNLLTIQKDDIIIFDTEYEEVDGNYKVVFE